MLVHVGVSCRSTDRPSSEPDRSCHNAGETEQGGNHTENREGQAERKQPQEHAYCYQDYRHSPNVARPNHTC